MRLIRQAGARLAVDGLDTHAAHERAHVPASQRIAFVLEPARQLTRPQERMLQMQLVDAPHEQQITFSNSTRTVVHR